MPTLVPRYSTTTGSVPSAGALTTGEVAYNLPDRRIYIKDGGGSVVELPLPGRWELIKEVTASNVAAVDLAHGSNGVVLNSTYDEYCVFLDRIVPATNASTLWLRTSTDAGVNFSSGVSDYVAHTSVNMAATTSAADAQIALTGTVSSTAGAGGVTGYLYIFEPSTTVPRFRFSGVYANTADSNRVASTEATGSRAATADVDGIRFLFSSGNVTSGTFRLYGRRK